MWLFSRIFKNDDLCKFGNCLYLSVNNLSIAAILFLRSDNYSLFPNLVTYTPQNQKTELRFIFSKLFDNDEVEKRCLEKNKEIADNYSSDKINQIRFRAKPEYFKFLKTPRAEFPQTPFKSAFTGVVFDCAFKGSTKSPMTTKKINTNLLPFAACVKFAFDQNDSGKISHLFGEVHVDQRGGSMFQVKAEAMLEKAKFFIS